MNMIASAFRLVTVTVAVAGSVFLSAAEPKLQVNPFPASVGVNIHFTTGHARDLDLIAEAGFRVVRMDFSWGGTEREKGVYRWGAYDELTRELLKRGIRPYYILDYSNPLYEETVASRNPVTGQEHKDTASPQHPESIEAFARWAAAAVTHFNEPRIIWEIWNEPNITFWKPKPDVSQYTALALATCRAIRQASSEAIIVAPATSEFPWPFLEQFLKSGVLEFLDSVSVHPYRPYNKGPETAGADYKRLRELIDAHAPQGKKIPILSGEWGYSSHDKGVSQTVQAEYIVRQQLFNLFSGLPVSIWYDWKNDGNDPKEREHNFGTVDQNLLPKSAYIALQTLTQELKGMQVSKRFDVSRPDTYLLLMRGAPDAQVLVAWTSGESVTAKVKLASRPTQEVTATQIEGTTMNLTATGQSITCRVTTEPVYIHLNGLQVDEVKLEQ